MLRVVCPGVRQPGYLRQATPMAPTRKEPDECAFRLNLRNFVGRSWKEAARRYQGLILGRHRSAWTEWRSC